MSAHGGEGVVAAALARAKRGYACELRARTHRAASDEPADRGGTDTGATPTELLLGALAACTAITLRMYADRKGWDLGEVRVECRLVQEGGARRIERELRFGAALDAKQHERLVDVAGKTPVTKLVADGTPVRTTVSG